MKFKYCNDCGNKLILRNIPNEGAIPHCNKCDKPFFDFSYNASICVVLNPNNEILLIKQNNIKTHYILVSGFTKPNETIEECAIREVKEETNLNIIKTRLLKTYYYEKKDILMIGVLCYTNNINYKLNFEVNEAKWFPIEKATNFMSKDSIAFKTVQKALKIIKEQQA